jgi:hypothetical protein
LSSFVDGDKAGSIPRRGGISKISDEERTELSQFATKRQSVGQDSDWQPPKTYFETGPSSCKNPLFEAQ